MADRFVTVGDDFTLPAVVKAADANMPAHAKAAAIAGKLDKSEAATTYALKADAAGGTQLLEDARLGRRADYDFRQSQADALVRHTAGQTLDPLYFLTANGEQAVVEFPEMADLNTPVPLVIHYGGAGNDSASFSTQVRPMISAALEAGFAVAACQFHGPDGYGSPDVMADTTALYNEILKVAPINGVILSGESMGGVAALNALTNHAVPSVLGVWLAQPVVHLRQRWDAGRSGLIAAAYGANPDGSDYDVKTAGYDPLLRSAWDFGGVPVHIRASFSDGTIQRVVHGDLLASKLAGYSPVTTSTATGPHGDISHFVPALYVAFLKSVVGRVGFAADPNNITTGLVYEFNAATLVASTANSAALTDWISTSPGTRTTDWDLTGVAGAQWPTLAHDAGNGHAAVVFDPAGGADSLTTKFLDPYLNTPLTITLAIRPKTTGAEQRVIAGTGSGWFGLNLTAGNQFMLTTQGTVNATPVGTWTPDTWHVVQIVFSATDSKLVVNGGAPISIGPATSADMSQLRMGSNASLGSPLKADVALIRYHNRELSNTELANHATYLMGKYV